MDKMESQMGSDSKYYHTNLSKYFESKPLYLDSPTQNKPNTRKLVEQAWQQTKGEMWDEVTETLCNLDFIQAKAAAKMTYELVNDFNAALEVIPNNAENIREEKARQARMDKYTQDLIACAKGEITIDELEVPESITPWTKTQRAAEIFRILNNPTRVDRLKEFFNFLGNESDNLQNLAFDNQYFTYQQAWNYTNGGFLRNAAEKGSPELYKFLLLRSKPARPDWDPLPQVLKTLVGYDPDGGLSVSITPDGKKALSGSGNTCTLWDLPTGKVLQRLEGHTSSVNSVSITPDGRRAISGSFDKNCILWDLIKGVVTSIQTLTGHTDIVNSVSITPDASRAISGSSDKTCILWDLTKGAVILTMTGHSDSVESVAITPDGKWAISGSQDKTSIIWDLTTGKAQQILKGHTHYVNAVSITFDGKFALSGSADSTCILWDLAKAEALQVHRGHTTWVQSVSITPDGKRAISSCSDKVCILWDLVPGETPHPKKGYTGAVWAIAVTPDGKRAISSSSFSECILWNLISGDVIHTLKGHRGYILSLAITPDSCWAVSGSSDISCIVWDLKTGNAVHTLKGHSGVIKTVAISPDGQQAISGSFDKTCILWDLTTGTAIRSLKGHNGKVNSVSITPEGQRAVSSSDDNTCILWNLSTGEILQTLHGHTETIMQVSITPDGKRAVSGSHDKTCILWDLKSGKELRKLIGHTKEVRQIIVSPNGRTAISGSEDGNCRQWELSTGKPLKLLKGLSGPINSIAISPDGKILLTGSEDKICTLWELESGKSMSRLAAASKIWSVAFFLGGVVLGCLSGEVIILNIDNTVFRPGLSISTIRKTWDNKRQQYSALSADCPICGARFKPSSTVVDTIKRISTRSGLKPGQSPCLELPEEDWEDPGLQEKCPNCSEKLKINPFIAGDNSPLETDLPAITMEESEKQKRDLEREKRLRDALDVMLKRESDPFSAAQQIDLRNDERGPIQDEYKQISDPDVGVKKITFQKAEEEILEIAEKAFKQGDWDNAYKLFLWLIQAQKYDANELRFKMAICKINSLVSNNPEIINNVQILIKLLQEKGATDNAQLITQKLAERLEELEKEELLKKSAGKPWWKKLF